MPYAYNPQVLLVHTLHTHTTGTDRLSARRYPLIADPLVRSSALGPLGSTHWKQRCQPHRRQSHREQSQRYFSNSRGDKNFIYNTIDGERVQVVRSTTKWYQTNTTTTIGIHQSIVKP